MHCAKGLYTPEFYFEVRSTGLNLQLHVGCGNQAVSLECSSWKDQIYQRY